VSRGLKTTALLESSSDGSGLFAALSVPNSFTVGSVASASQYLTYASSRCGVLTTWPTLRWPKMPEVVMFVEPVHTATGAKPPSPGPSSFLERRKNLLCEMALTARLRRTTRSSMPAARTAASLSADGPCATHSLRSACHAAGFESYTMQMSTPRSRAFPSACKTGA